MGEQLTLGLYLVQQLGVMLGVGSAAITLVAHVVANRDGVVDAGEAKFAHTIERVLMVGLFLIISSGVGITVLHMLAGETSTIFTPAYILKWYLIAVVALPLIVGHVNPFPAIDLEGFFGAHWFALYILHIVAPIASWLDLLIAYILFVVVFHVLWGIIARSLRARVDGAPAKPAVKLAPAVPKMAAVTVPAPVVKPTPPPASQPKPIVVAVSPVKPPAPVKVSATPAPHKPEELPAPHGELPKPAMPTKPALSVTAKPPEKPPTKPEEKIVDPDQSPSLPAIRVMPRTPEDMDKQLRASVVQFT